MPHTPKKSNAANTGGAPRPRRRLKVWQRLFLAVAILIVLALLSTVYMNYANRPVEEDTAVLSSSWKAPVYAYVIADEDVFTAQLYTEGLSLLTTCGRGTYIELESWTPFVSEDGTKYYHFFKDGNFGYILTKNVSQDSADILQETTVYVRTAMNLRTESDGLALGVLAEKGTSLSVIGYDTITEDGNVNMYQVKMGTEIGWIHSEYVCLTFLGAMENWTNDANVYQTHVERGDPYGGGDAGSLDYWPREKGDFSDVGNVMPDSCYSIYIPLYASCIENIDEYLAFAQSTQINTFVFTIQDGGSLAYPSPVLQEYGLLSHYNVQCTMEAYAEALGKVKDAGYYTVCRITAFNDTALAGARSAWAFCNLDGSLLSLDGKYWPSPYSRNVWEVKVALAVEAAQTFGFNEVMFDEVQFPYGIGNYEAQGTVNLQNEYHEEKAQALQRFLMYAADVLHQNSVYLSAVVYGETAESYVDSYGHYWPAFSTVLDVICGAPYPEQFTNYWTNSGYYRAYQHPYSVLSTWGAKVNWRQQECASPAKVRTWIQIWDNTYYNYDAAAIQREILGLFDNDITDGYMTWNYYGSMDEYEKMKEVFQTDYYELWLGADAAGQSLSKYMGVETSDSQ